MLAIISLTNMFIQYLVSNNNLISGRQLFVQEAISGILLVTGLFLLFNSLKT